MEAPLWKATKTPGIRTLCFLSVSLPPHPSLFFSLDLFMRGLFAAVEYTAECSCSQVHGELGRGPR